jgi:hypothetical protein
MVSSTWLRAIYTIIDRAGVRRRANSNHAFRKTLNTNFTRLGIRPDVLDAMFGWAKSTVRSRYYTGEVAQDARDAIQLAYTDDPISPGTIAPSAITAHETPTLVSDSLEVELARLERARLENENYKMQLELRRPVAAT